jgi:hypothetical protein
VPHPAWWIGRQANSSKISRKPGGHGDSLGRRVEHQDGQANQKTSTKEAMMATDVEIRPAQQPQAQDRPEEGPLAVAPRQQILDAMDPVMDDLLQDIQEAVHQQIEYVLRMSEQEVQHQVDQAVEPMRQEVQHQVDQAVQEAKLDQKRAPQTQLQQAIDRTVKALKKTLQWLTSSHD